jgi:DNA-binding ferritin-like protein
MGLKRSVLARFWRLKAIEILNNEQIQYVPRQQGRSTRMEQENDQQTTQQEEPQTGPITGALNNGPNGEAGNWVQDLNGNWHKSNLSNEEFRKQLQKDADKAAERMKAQSKRKNWTLNPFSGFRNPFTRQGKDEDESEEEEQEQPRTSNSGRGAGRGSKRGRIFAMPEPPQDKRSALEKMRDKVADMDEDYKDAGERVLGFFIQLVGYVFPFLFVIWVGSDLGKYFAPVMDTVPAYGLAYSMEAVIAALTVSMGRSFAEIASGKARYGSAALVVMVWLVLNASSALMLYLVISHNDTVSGFERYSMMIRVLAIALGDLGCSTVLMFKGRSLQRHIDSIRKRATAIGELADAQRSIEEADKNAALREAMMKSTLKIQEDLSNKIGDAVSMVMKSILERMEKALKDDDRNERGYGRR